MEEKHQSVASCTCPNWELGPIMQACALTGSRTGELLLCGTNLNQLSHAGHGFICFYCLRLFPSFSVLYFKSLENNLVKCLAYLNIYLAFRLAEFSSFHSGNN